MIRNVMSQKMTILCFLEKRPLTTSELTVELRLSIDTVRKRIKELKKSGRIYISGWISRVYAFEAVYSVGHEPDVPKPKLDHFRKRNSRPKAGRSEKSLEKASFRREFLDDLAFRVVSTRMFSS